MQTIEQKAAGEIRPDRVYLTEEAAALLRVKAVTIRRAKRLGHIRAHGRPFRILGSELLRFALGGASK